MAQTVKNLPAMPKMQVQSLGQEDPLKDGLATHSSILAWTMPWTEEPGRLQSTGSQRVRQDLVTKQQRCEGLEEKGRGKEKGFFNCLDFWQKTKPTF